MSVEIFVLSDRKLTSIAEWQRAIDEEGFALKLDTSRPFDELSGHLPSSWGEREAGFECDHFDAAQFIGEMAHIEFTRPWKHLLAFRVGANFCSLMGANMAAAAYARATEGVVYDEASGEFLSPDAAAKMARECEEDLPRMERMWR